MLFFGGVRCGRNYPPWLHDSWHAISVFWKPLSFFRDHARNDHFGWLCRLCLSTKGRNESTEVLNGLKTSDFQHVRRCVCLCQTTRSNLPMRKEWSNWRWNPVLSGWAGHPFISSFITWLPPGRGLKLAVSAGKNTHHGHIIGREHLMGRLDQSTEERDTVISIVIISLL